MERIKASNQQFKMEMSNLEEQLVQWRQSYQKHLQMLAEFRLWQEGFDSQMELHEQHVHNLHEMHEERKRVVHERTRES